MPGSSCDILGLSVLIPETGTMTPALPQLMGAGPSQSSPTSYY